MQTQYPEVYKVVMDPNSSDGDLKKAMLDFFGYTNVGQGSQESSGEGTRMGVGTCNNAPCFITHEYTENNLNFALTVDPHNSELLNFADKILTQKSKEIPTIPTILEDEINCNPFLRSDNPEIAKNIGRGKMSAQETFKYLRKMKDDF